MTSNLVTEELLMEILENKTINRTDDEILDIVQDNPKQFHLLVEKLQIDIQECQLKIKLISLLMARALSRLKEAK